MKPSTERACQVAASNIVCFDTAPSRLCGHGAERHRASEIDATFIDACPVGTVVCTSPNLQQLAMAAALT